MTLAQRQALAHELTMEYLKVNTEFLKGNMEDIPKMVDMVAEINRRFYDSLIHNEKFTGLY
ncbi:MAG: hypothetical protein IJ316_01880 [Clostridia bacterium]|nr:hypothetical protein [Clostridia bacterium]